MEKQKRLSDEKVRKLVRQVMGQTLERGTMRTEYIHDRVISVARAKLGKAFREPTAYQVRKALNHMEADGTVKCEHFVRGWYYSKRWRLLPLVVQGEN